MNLNIKGIYYAWHSDKQAIVSGGHCLYRLVNGDIVRVTEVTKDKAPSGKWDDYTFLGEVDMSADCIILPQQSLSLPEMFSNYKKIDPEFKLVTEEVSPDCKKFSHNGCDCFGKN